MPTPTASVTTSASRCFWFWQMFDRSPIGLNHWLGIRFRCMLGRHIFEHMGAGVKIYHGVDLTYGYNLSIGDGVTIRQRALLNDRGGITIGKNAVIGSFARVYSHTPQPGKLRPGHAGAHGDRRRRSHWQPRHRAGRPERSPRRGRRQLSLGPHLRRVIGPLMVKVRAFPGGTVADSLFV